ncbi:MAG TPA: hypothetical protein VET24_03855, partial [Actinomycetota bacterium]|nr:hypothetical protein [Actinomycetota bacterium]
MTDAVCAECLLPTPYGELCANCRSFKHNNPTARCTGCGRRTVVGRRSRCRRCIVVATTLAQEQAVALEPVGVQLFFSGIGLFRPANVSRTPHQPAPPAEDGPRGSPKPRAVYHPGQLKLLTAPADLRRARIGRPTKTEDPSVASLLAAANQFGEARGWGPTTLRRIRNQLRLLLALQEPGEVEPDTVAGLAGARRIAEFLADHGLIQIDTEAPFDRWVAAHLAPLPAGIRSEAWGWVEVLRGRTNRGGRARDILTIQAYLRQLLPALATWSGGYESLRQVTSEDIVAQLESLQGSLRRLATSAMRSLFQTLKAQRTIFADPTVGMGPLSLPPTPVLPVEAEIRAALLAQTDSPATGLVVLLAGVHTSRSGEICRLSLDAVDLAGSKLVMKGGPRPLDGLTAGYLGAWLEHRRRRWPATANPYLLV